MGSHGTSSRFGHDDNHLMFAKIPHNRLGCRRISHFGSRQSRPEGTANLVHDQLRKYICYGSGVARLRCRHSIDSFAGLILIITPSQVLSMVRPP